MEKHNNIHIGNQYFSIYLLYIILVIGIEWLNFLVKISEIAIPVATAEIIAVLIVFCLIRCTKKHIQINHFYTNKWIIIGIILISVLGFMMSVYPDTGYDTFNYHLISQNPSFENYFIEDYGYGNFQVWGFRLADRLFYYFRYFLGYRFGTLLNTVVLAIAFIQLFDLLKQCSVVATEKKVSDLYLAIWSLIILLPLDAVFMFGSYYVDILAIPIAIEIMRLLFTRKENITIPEVSYFALLNGIWIALKLTNIVFVIPCVMIYIFYNIRKSKITHWICAVIFFFVPFIIYAIYNYICTGNPVFPYFNSIFKSPYFDNIDFKDTRWGGQTFFEKLFWLVFATVKPTDRQSEVPDLIPPVILYLGLIGICVLLYLLIFHKKAMDPQKTWCLIFIAIFSSIFWGFSTGYSRYYIFGKILWGIIAFTFILYLYLNFKKVGKAISTLLLLICCGCVCGNTISSFCGRNWKWTAFKPDTFIQELKKCVIDNDIAEAKLFSADAFLSTEQSDMGVAELINGDLFVINAQYPLFNRMKDEIYSNHLAEDSKVFDIHKRAFYDANEYLEKLNSLSLKMKKMSSITVGSGEYLLVDICVEKEPDNKAWKIDKPLDIQLDNMSEGLYELKFITGRTYDWNTAPELSLEIKMIKTDSQETIATIPVSNKEFTNHSVPVYISSDDKEIEIYLSNDGLINDPQNLAIILNWELEIQEERKSDSTEEANLAYYSQLQGETMMKDIPFSKTASCRNVGRRTVSASSRHAATHKCVVKCSHHSSM